MERTTFGMTFYIRRTKLDKTGKAPVFLRITMNGLRADTSIKYHISPQLWNTAKGRALENSREGKEVNRMLEAVGFNIMQVRRQLESEGVAVSAQSILSRYLGKDAPQRHTLMEVFREHNEKCRALSGIDFAPTTVQRYESLFRITSEFLRAKYGQDDFYLDDLPEQLVEDYEFYMKTDRRCAHNTVMKNLKNFKKIIRIAMTNGWLKNDPFREKHIHMEQVERAFLEKHEFLHVLEKQIDIPRIRQVRDIFCFCGLTGLTFTDVQQLKPEHIVKDINGMNWIRKARQKTRNMCNIPLLDAARKILERYKDNPYCHTRRSASGMQQPEDERIFEGTGGYLRHSETPLDTLRKAYLCHSDTRKRCDYRECRQDARTCQYQHDTALCTHSGLFHHAGYAVCGEEYGDIAVRSYDRTAADWNGRGERILPEDTILRFEPNNEFMDCILIETRAYDELHALITRLTSRISELAALSNVSPLPQRWMTSEEVCKALSITPRALQYYRLRGIVPFTFIGNKVLFKEVDIRHVLDSNLIKTV